MEFTGTKTGPLHMGDQEIPATGRSVVGTETYFASVRDGKIVSFRGRIRPDRAGPRPPFHGRQAAQLQRVTSHISFLKMI